jgi:hypothetical protein
MGIERKKERMVSGIEKKRQLLNSDFNVSKIVNIKRRLDEVILYYYH